MSPRDRGSRAHTLTSSAPWGCLLDDTQSVFGGGRYRMEPLRLGGESHGSCIFVQVSVVTGQFSSRHLLGAAQDDRDGAPSGAKGGQPL